VPFALEVFWHSLRVPTHFKNLIDSINTGTPSGRFLFHVMVSLAELDRELVVERIRVGLEVANWFDHMGGRKPKITDSKIESTKKLLFSGVPSKEVGKNLSLSVLTLYRWVSALRGVYPNVPFGAVSCG
jgi:DNA invertase Pin-like site-specific DNA recombinase